MIKTMVRLRLCQFVVASLMMILLLSPFTQQINGLDDFVNTGNDLESQTVGIFTLIGLALVTVRGLLPRFRPFKSGGTTPIGLVSLFDRAVIGMDRAHVLHSEFVLLRI